VTHGVISTTLIYFGCGVLYDLLATSLYICVGKREALKAGFASLAVTAFSCIVIYNLVLSPNAYIRVIAYSLGCGIGTALTIYGRKFIKRRCDRDESI
jgi:hypothetical protein